MIKVLNDIFVLEGKNIQYAFGPYKGLLRHIYFGNKVDERDFQHFDIEDISSNDSAYDIAWEEYTPWGGLRYKEPAVKVRFSDGTRDLVLEYYGFLIEEDILRIRFRDKFYPIEIFLNYKMYEEYDILARWVEFKNLGKEDIFIEKAYSCELNLEGTGYYITNVLGYWAGEGRRFKEKLEGGKLILESRKGNTGHNNNPYFILDIGADEDRGEVYFGTLEYSGNFKILVEATPYYSTRVLMGFNDFDFEYRLKPSEGLIVPKAYLGYTDKGYSDMSKRLHSFARDIILPGDLKNSLRPVLFNSWEATLFDVKCHEQIELARKAKDIGCELFVVDDGWFGERNSDAVGLGDWEVNKEKFPKGLEELIDEVNRLGMEFGLWIEPEMVNPNSKLYKEHPEWVYRFNNRELTTARNQLVLNLTLKEVKDYLFNVLDGLLTNYNIKYIKWDMNRPFSEAGALNLDIKEQKMIWFLHSRAVFEIVERLRNKHKGIEIEACASGGGRVDFGILNYFDEFWASDNTDALDRLLIQESVGYIYPAKAMRCWVTDCPNFISGRTIPIEFRFHVAMMGALGIGGNLNKWSKEEFDLAKKKIKQYKEIRHIVQHGELFRIKSITKDEIHALQYVYKGESVLFAFKAHQRFGRKSYKVKLKGLKDNKIYEVKYDDKIIRKGGAYLKNLGIDIILDGDFSSQLIIIKEV
ncbi:MAG: alpha-galactosidase [Caloramator sp.]|nr:alpha-galactosidase [Caloramator sp.]